MKLRLTGAQLRAAAEGIDEIGAKELPAGVAFRIARLARGLRDAVEDVGATELKILERYMERDAAGKPVPGSDDEGNPKPGTVRISDAEQFEREMQALLGAETELDVQPLALAELEAADVRVAPRTLLALGELLRE